MGGQTTRRGRGSPGPLDPSALKAGAEPTSRQGTPNRQTPRQTPTPTGASSPGGRQGPAPPPAPAPPAKPTGDEPLPRHTDSGIVQKKKKPEASELATPQLSPLKPWVEGAPDCVLLPQARLGLGRGRASPPLSAIPLPVHSLRPQDQPGRGPWSRPRWSREAASPARVPALPFTPPYGHTVSSRCLELQFIRVSLLRNRPFTHSR